MIIAITQRRKRRLRQGRELTQGHNWPTELGIACGEPNYLLCADTQTNSAHVLTERGSGCLDIPCTILLRTFVPNMVLPVAEGGFAQLWALD